MRSCVQSVLALSAAVLQDLDTEVNVHVEEAVARLEL